MIAIFDCRVLKKAKPQIIIDNSTQFTGFYYQKLTLKKHLKLYEVYYYSCKRPIKAKDKGSAKVIYSPIIQPS
jgi:hypothetical protein